MKKLFLSADIEGSCGIAHWDETEKEKPLYEHFARQMTREVVAACEGAAAAGAEEILIKDAHDSARNIDPECLPEYARIFRGWARHPYSMMYGIDKSFDGAIFTGYHSGAGMDTNPLAHTMNLGIRRVTINDEIAPELYINALTAAYEGVPVRCVTGDKGLCDWVKTKNANIFTVPVNEGVGNGCFSIHPNKAVSRIRETVKEAVLAPAEKLLFPLPEKFHVTVEYREHYTARRAGFYPGAKQTGPYTAAFDAADYMDVLVFFSFCL